MNSDFEQPSWCIACRNENVQLSKASPELIGILEEFVGKVSKISTQTFKQHNMKLLLEQSFLSMFIDSKARLRKIIWPNLQYVQNQGDGH